jgi:hypothetical protein
MECPGLSALVVVVLFGGCAPAAEPAHPATTAPSSSAEKHFPAWRNRPFKPPREMAAKDPSPPRLRDDFDLPLVIRIDAPEVPPEIEKKSPPIQEQSKSP